MLNENKQLGDSSVKKQTDTQQTTIVNVLRLGILMKYAFYGMILVLHCGVYTLICARKTITAICKSQQLQIDIPSLHPLQYDERLYKINRFCFFRFMLMVPSIDILVNFILCHVYKNTYFRLDDRCLFKWHQLKFNIFLLNNLWLTSETLKNSRKMYLKLLKMSAECLYLINHKNV